MTIEMYINNILIDRSEMDFRYCDTMKKREEHVQDMAVWLLNQHLSKAFISNIKPVFCLRAESKANNIIMDDYYSNELEDEVENELDLARRLKK